MIKPDVIAINAVHVDFPMFRYQIRQYRHLYNDVIIGFSNHHRSMYLKGFIKEAMKNDHCTFVNDIKNLEGKDWRDVAVNNCLEKSTSSHVLFLEQDFIIHNPEVLKFALSDLDKTVGFREEKLDRLHPAFLLVSREKLEKTSKDFSAKPPDWDHFGKLWIDLESQGEKPVLLEDTQFQSPQDWEHMAGMTHNYSLLTEGQPPNYRVERFREYNKELLNLDIEQSPEFLRYIRIATK